MKLRYGNRALLLTLLALVPLLNPRPIERAAAAKSANQSVGVRWGFYITYNPNSWASLQVNARYLNYVSPWFYGLNADGQVTGRDQPQVGSLLRQVGAKSLPMIKNTPQYNDFTAVLTDTNKQADIINQIDALVASNRYDGITIDFEGLNPTDKPMLTAFMGSLYARLHPEGKLVAMAIAAKTKEITTGWAAAYDYPALGAVTDYLLVMAYDYHWATGDPGPVAPMDRLRPSADYTVARVPANKVVWGVGVYGYDWGLNPTGGWDGQHAEYRAFSEANTLAATPGAQSGYDEGAQAPWVQYQRDNQTRQVWYENVRSFNAKLQLIQDYGMAGFGIWRIGQEDPAIWASIEATRQPTACAPVDPPDPSSSRVFFSETGHTLGGTFLRYWRAHGGLPIYGYPLTEEFTETSPTDGKPYKVQYFERNRFEYHPENKPPNDVLLGLLGVQTTQGQAFPTSDGSPVDPNTLYFPQVLHTLGGSFLRYWRNHGGLAQFGYPISEPLQERSSTDGQTYTVQYFERARFEYHPEYEGSNTEVLLGLLGRDVVPCR